MFFKIIDQLYCFSKIIFLTNINLNNILKTLLLKLILFSFI